MSINQISPTGETKKIVARWTSKQGRYFIVLFQDELGYSYESDNGGGNFGDISLARAMNYLEEVVESLKSVDGIQLKLVEN